MSGILRLFLVPPARQAIQQRYRGYRQQGASAFAAFFATLFAIFGWIVLRLESEGWQQIRAQRTYWFPHISPQRPRPADILRYLTQGLWLLTIKNGQLPTSRRNYFSALPRWRQRYMNAQQTLFARFSHANADDREDSDSGSTKTNGIQMLVTVILSLLCAALALLCITQPFDLLSQFIFMTLLWGIAMLVRNMPGRMPTLMMIALSFTVSCRYLWWRYAETLNWDNPLSLTCGMLLLAAETYAWVVLVLGYFQTIWPLNRHPVSLPEDSKTWPTVDLMIPTYNEPLGVVKPTVYAALGIDWPKDKLNIYILDDGGRAEFKAFAEEVGVHYIARVTHEHAQSREHQQRPETGGRRIRRHFRL
nr:glycosyltransferase [Pectobacterium colocasium]